MKIYQIWQSHIEIWSSRALRVPQCPNALSFSDIIFDTHTPSLFKTMFLGYLGPRITPLLLLQGTEALEVPFLLLHQHMLVIPNSKLKRLPKASFFRFDIDIKINQTKPCSKEKVRSPFDHFFDKSPSPWP